MSTNPTTVPQVPEVQQERISVNVQCADIEDWDDKAFPLMIERSDGDPTKENPYTTLSIHTADLMVALLTKRLRLATPTGIMECPPCIEDHPDLIPLVQWLKAASTSVKSRRSQRQRQGGK